MSTGVSSSWQQAAVSLAQALAAQEAQLERLRAEADDIARWIVEQWGYPVEVGTEKPPPEPWRRRIEDAWVERDGDPNNPDYDEDIRIMVGVEGGWVG